MNSRSVASLAFICFQLTTATLFLRPAEIFEPLRGLPIFEGLILLTAVLSAFELQGHFSWRMMRLQPITVCVIGLLIAIAISHLSHAYFGGALESTEEFAKTVVYFALLISTVNTPSRIKLLAANVAICGATMVSLCVIDYAGYYDFDFIEQLIDIDDFDEEGLPILIVRLRGCGIFQDPNDVSMLINAVLVLCVYFLTDRSLQVFRVLWLCPMVTLLIGLFMTQSRGGLLAVVGTLSCLAVGVWGRKALMVVGLCGVMALPVASGRIFRIDLSPAGTGTAHERFTMWREGFHALKSPNILFGIGHDLYADLDGLVAHNSFIHAYVELGLFGGTFFFGCFYLALLQAYYTYQRRFEISHKELLRFHPFLVAILFGWMFSMMSLSRCYVMPTYLVVGMAAAYMNLAGLHSKPPRPLLEFNKTLLWKLGSSSAFAFAGLFVLTYVLNRI